MPATAETVGGGVPYWLSSTEELGSHLALERMRPSVHYTISPVHKGGSRGTPANYRPVALTSHITKMFERVVRRWLVAHLEDNNLLPDGQHGFRAKRSCLTQLLAYWDNILDQLEEGKGVDVVYTDFAKAFDKCETGVLLHKLKECGVRGKLGCWIAAFLDPSVRKQAVGVDEREAV